MTRLETTSYFIIRSIMNPKLQIYFDRLKSGNSEEINLTLTPDFMEINDKDLAFLSPITVDGEAYLAETELVFKLKLVTEATLPCLMCNEPVNCTIEVDDFYHVEPTAENKSGVFEYGDLVREAILMQTPAFIECHNGQCPQREASKKYLKKPDGMTFPFSGIDK